MIPDISLIVPAIRTPRWAALCNSLSLACKRFNWEIIFISPFDLPDELTGNDHIHLLKDQGGVSRCIQRGVLQARAPLIFSTVDDCVFKEDSIDKALSLWNGVATYKTIMAASYSEGGDILPKEYLVAHYHGNLRLPGIPQHYKIAPQFIMLKTYFEQLGGFDCSYEYSNASVHDFLFRAQNDGANVIISPDDICIASWSPEETGDHMPVHRATLNDEVRFNQKYSFPQHQTSINYNNWQDSPEVWERRFLHGVPKTYEELVAREGYILK